MKKGYAKPWEQYMGKYKDLYWQPGKPTEHEREIYTELVKRALSKSDSKPKKALILGSTPAVRDSLAKADCEVTCLDLSKDIFDAMSQLINHNKKETFVEASWLEMPFEDNTFDFVTGDLAIGNVDMDNKQKLLSEIRRVLKPSGFYSPRVFIYPDKWIYNTTEKIFKRFEELDESCDRSTELFCHFLYNAYDPELNEIDVSKLKNLLKEFWNGSSYVHPVKKIQNWLNTMYEMYKPFEKLWTVGTKKEVYSWIEQKFEIIDEMIANDHIMADTFYFVECKPKK